MVTAEKVRITEGIPPKFREIIAKNIYQFTKASITETGLT